LNDQPVGTAAVFLFGEVAVLADVAVLPVARGRGIGTSMIRFTLREARMHNFQIGGLRAPESAVTLFQHVGFQEYCSFKLYEWPLKKR
jgi:GNAT superfamily N-acetyltransferase